MTRETTVLEIGGLHWATSEPVIVKTLLDRPGVPAGEASAVSQTATVTYDPDKTSVAQLLGWVNDCGYHRTGQSAPGRMGHPMAEPAPTAAPAGHGGDRIKEETASTRDHDTIFSSDGPSRQGRRMTDSPTEGEP